MTAQDDEEAVDALAGAGVHLVRHRRGADLAREEALAGEFVAGHEAEGAREGGRTGSGGDEGGDDLKVHRARVDLADRTKGVRDAEVGEHALLEARDLGEVAGEKGELIELGADGALEAAGRERAEGRVELGRAAQAFLAEHRPALAHRGGLGGDVVRAGGDKDVAVGDGAAREAGHGGDVLGADQLERAEDLELLDRLREVAAGEPLVDMLVAGEGAELVDAGLHVVARRLLADADGFEVHLVLHALVGGDGLGGDVQPEVALGLHDGDPILALEDHAAAGGPDGLHRRGGVAIGEDVGNEVGFHRKWAYSRVSGGRQAPAGTSRARPPRRRRGWRRRSSRRTPAAGRPARPR